MLKVKQVSRAFWFAVLPIVAALTLIMLLMSSCASGQSSSASASSSANSASQSSASASSSAQAKTIDKSAFVGTWDMVDMEKDGVLISEVNPGAIPTMSEENYLNVSEDGFFELVEQGDVIQGVWKARSETEGIMMFGSDEVNASITDGTLSLSLDGVTLSFEKGEARDTPSLPEGQPDLREILGG